jgi:hypothetical protein
LSIIQITDLQVKIYQEVESFVQRSAGRKSSLGGFKKFLKLNVHGHN